MVQGRITHEVAPHEITEHELLNMIMPVGLRSEDVAATSDPATSRKTSPKTQPKPRRRRPAPVTDPRRRATAVPGTPALIVGGAGPGRGHQSVAPIVGEAIADAVDGQHVARPARVGLELAAQVLDVRVDRPLVRLEGDPVQRVEELRPGEDAARAAPRGSRAAGTRSASARRPCRRPRPASAAGRGRRRRHGSSRPPRAAGSARRRTARTRATSSRGLNGLVR